MRARPRRDDDEVGEADYFGDGRLDRRRRVDDEELDAELAHARDVGGEAPGAGARKERRLRRARVPPLRETALRIGVDQRHRPEARAISLDREMTRQRRLAG